MSSQFRTDLRKTREAKSGKAEVVQSHNCYWGKIEAHGDPLFVYSCSKDCRLTDVTLQTEGVNEGWTIFATIFEGLDLVQNDQQKLTSKMVYPTIQLKAGQKVVFTGAYKGSSDAPRAIPYIIDFFMDFKNGR